MMAASMVLLCTVNQLYCLVILAALALGYIAYEVNVLYLTTGNIGIAKNGYGGLDNNGAGLMLAMGVPICVLLWDHIRRPMALVLPGFGSRDHPCRSDDVFPGCDALAAGYKSARCISLPETLADRSIGCASFSLVRSQSWPDRRSGHVFSRWKRMRRMRVRTHVAGAGRPPGRWHWITRSSGWGSVTPTCFRMSTGPTCRAVRFTASIFRSPPTMGLSVWDFTWRCSRSVWADTRFCRLAVKGRDDLQSRRIYLVATGVETSMAVFCFGGAFLSLENFRAALFASAPGITTRGPGERPVGCRAGRLGLGYR